MSATPRPPKTFVFTEQEAARFQDRIDRSEECWTWSGPRRRGGYGIFVLYSTTPSSRVFAHRFAWVAANGPIPSGMYVCHRCDNRPCVRVDHLFLGTISDNNADKLAKGRRRGGGPGGADNSHAKISEADAIALRAEYATGLFSQAELGTKYGLTQTTVGKLVNGKSWKHLGDAVAPTTPVWRHPAGEANGNARMTATDVLEIRRLHSEGSSYGLLGQRFGVTKQLIYQIVRRKAWKHV